MSLSGLDILDTVFSLRDINSWGMFGTLLAWIALFRLTHYFAFAYEVWPFMKKLKASSSQKIDTDIELV